MKTDRPFAPAPDSGDASSLDTITPAAFLGVERSVLGKRWRARLADESLAAAIGRACGLPEIVCRVLAARGVSPEGCEAFLDPTLKRNLPDPSHLIDMDKAVERVVRAITTGETIGVFGDYDVDGASAAALLVRFFAALGRAVPVYVPDRIAEGYGPNTDALLKLKASGCAVVITVDCGTAAHAPLAAARAAGLDVIVIDHHVAEDALPEAFAIVNPNRKDETSEHRGLCAAGVAFLLIVAVNRALRAAYWYGEGHAEPDLRMWLDLVALGTICDVVPLTGVNRALVAQGLKVMAGRRNPGLAALAEVAGLKAEPDAYHAGFVLGPRVNAGGRVGEAGLGARLLATDDPAEAFALAQRLESYNAERRNIEAGVQRAALKLAEAQAAAGDPVIVVAGDGWHPGVVGIVAGRLKERFNRPACVVGMDGGTGKGSGRSVPGFALGPAIIAAHREGLLIAGGGHAMAAGFTVAAGKIDALRAFLGGRAMAELGGALPAPTLGLDGVLECAGASCALVDLIERAGPFGQGNARPRFAFPAVQVVRAEVVGTDHVRCFLTSPSAGARLKAIAFRSAGTELGRALLERGALPLHVAGHLKAETWNGTRSADLVIEDAAVPA